LIKALKLLEKQVIMNIPEPDDYIDIHNHSAVSSPGKYSIGNLLANENVIPDETPGLSYSYGIHPWHLAAESFSNEIEKVNRYSVHQNVIALGEAGFDRLKGPSLDLQRNAFEEQVAISERVSKPLFIHCVKAWDELLAAHRKLSPSKSWIIHGFRGKRELAEQLISKGMYLSFWFDFILRPESSTLIRSLPRDRYFLETDGSGVDISDIYKKVVSDIEVSVSDLKTVIYSNFISVFK
jgi:TatD DNase family protein